MPWLRTGDNVATHPMVLNVIDHTDGDFRAVNEVFGFVMRCALQSAGHITDYVVDMGTAYMIGGPETERLLELAVKIGYLKEIKRRTPRAWKLIDDPDFIHMRTRAEIDWEKQQRSDNSNAALTVPVRARDGDACRYCGTVVNWMARKGKLAGTYDHRIPGQAATVDTLVVACGACNAGRRDDPNADERYPLRPAPSDPFYGKETAAFLTRYKRPTEPTPRVRSADGHGKTPAVSAEPFAETVERLPSESGFAGSGRSSGRSSGRARTGTGRARS